MPSSSHFLTTWCAMEKVGYFAMGAGMGPVFSYVSLIMLQRGMSIAVMGVLMSMWPLSRMLLNPLLTFLADKTRRPEVIVSVCAAVSAVSMCVATAVVSGLSIVEGTMISFFATAASLNPLYDQHVLALLGEARKAEWGANRMLLSIGYGIATPVAGALADALGWWVIGVFWAATHTIVAVAFLLTPVGGAEEDHTTAAVRGNDVGDTKASSASEAHKSLRFSHALKCVWNDRYLLHFVVQGSAIGAALQAINTFLFPLVSELGGGTTLMGASITAMVAIETLVFWQSKWLLSKVSLHQLLLAGLMTLTLRCAGYVVMPSAWWVLPLNSLHGISFACSWLAAVQTFSKRVPAAMGNTGMGLLNMGVWGFGSLLGNVVGGALYQTWGARIMFACFAGLSAVCSVAFVLVAGDDLADDGAARTRNDKKTNSHRELDDKPIPSSGAGVVTSVSSNAPKRAAVEGSPSEPMEVEIVTEEEGGGVACPAPSSVTMMLMTCVEGAVHMDCNLPLPLHEEEAS